MHQSMVESAQRHEVGEARLTAMCPVLQVVTVHIALERAARETAALVARVKCAADTRRNRACLAADVERLAVTVLGNRHDAGIAGEAPRGFRGERWSMFELAATGVRVL